MRTTALLALAACPSPECPPGTRFLHGACVAEDTTSIPLPTGDTGGPAATAATGHTGAAHTGDPTLASDGPAMFRADPGRTGYFPGPAPTAGAIAWSVPLGEACSVPVARGGLVYASSVRTLTAVDTSTHLERWSFRAEANLQATPAVSDDLVVIGDRLGKVYGLRPSDGEPLWDTVGAGPCSSPAITEQGVWITCGVVALLDLATGDVIRSVPSTDLDPDQALTVAEDLVVGGDGPLRAWDQATLELAWATDLGRSTATASAAAATLWTATESGSYQVGTHQGGVLWATDPVSSLREASPAVAGGVVYFATTRALRARDAETGAELWSALLPRRVVGGVAVAGDAVFVTDEGGAVHAVARRDGASRWSEEVAACTEPALADGVLYVGSPEGLLALR